VILGGGFGGVYTARHLESLCGGRADVEIVLVSRDNFLLMTPLLFEICSGSLGPHHCSFPVRAFLRTTRFIEAAVAGVDLERRVVRLRAADESAELPYDQLVLALGARTNREMVAGSEHAFTFKNLADAILLRNHIVERFERADVETSPDRKREQLTFVIIGGGLVGVELLGELTAFVDGILPYYRHIKRSEIRLLLLQGGPRIIPEIDPKLADYAGRVFARHPEIEIRTAAHVQAIEPGKVQLAGETLVAATIVLAAGIVPSPVVAALPVEKDKRGHIVVDGAMRCPNRPEVWALGDCAVVPSPDGTPYPALAQHALREARQLAQNIVAVLDGGRPQPFVYQTLGMMGSLGRCTAFGKMLGLRLHGFPAWFVRRSYYLLQMPGWVRRVRIMIDWSFALLFRPDIVKLSVDSETAVVVREIEEAATTATPAEKRVEEQPSANRAATPP
jgi:NADH dehydrogenase